MVNKQTGVAHMEIQVSLYQALAIKHALRFYAKTGMRVNKAYTPKNMIAMAEKITGKKFTARDYMGAADALHDFIVANSPAANAA
jgi:hypothetical protein